jgi:hypothetical protein
VSQRQQFDVMDIVVRVGMSKIKELGSKTPTLSPIRGVDLQMLVWPFCRGDVSSVLGI